MKQRIESNLIPSPQSLAAAIGPLAFRDIYKVTKESELHGAFWLLGTFFFLVSIIVIWMLPEEQANSRYITLKRGNNNLDESRLIRVDEEDGMRETIV